MPGSVDPVDPVAAIDYFRAKSRLTDGEFEADATANHAKSFTLAGVADIDVIDHVFIELDKAISKGSDFREFQASCKTSLENAWGGTVSNPGWRIETIFRTNVQNAYQAGRYKEAREGQTDRPYGLFSDVPDDRESDICGDIGDDIRGKAIALDDPIWDKVWPPNHHDCRSDVITLTEAEAIEQGLLDPEDVPSPEDVEVADGFDSTPDSYEPDPEEYGELQADVERFIPESPKDAFFGAQDLEKTSIDWSESDNEARDSFRSSALKEVESLILPRELDAANLYTTGSGFQMMRAAEMSGDVSSAEGKAARSLHNAIGRISEEIGPSELFRGLHVSPEIASKWVEGSSFEDQATSFWSNQPSTAKSFARAYSSELRDREIPVLITGSIRGMPFDPPGSGYGVESLVSSGKFKIISRELFMDPKYGSMLVLRVEEIVDTESVMHAIRKYFNENHDADGKFGTVDGGSGGSGGSHVSIKDHDKVQKASNGIFGREISHKDIQDFVGVHGLDIPGAHSIEHTVRTHGSDGLHLEAKVKDKEGKTLLEVKRQINVDWETGSKQIQAHHDKMIVSEELQGNGIGSKLFDRQLEHYRSLGIVNQITTDAAWTGQYQWPRLGFGLRNPAHLEGLKSELAQFAHEKGLKVDLSKVKTVHDLSKLATKEPFQHDGMPWTKLGKAFLLSRPEGHEIGLKFDIGPKSKEMKDYVKSGKH